MKIHFYKMQVIEKYILTNKIIIQGLLTTILLQSSNISFISLFFSLLKWTFDVFI